MGTLNRFLALMTLCSTVAAQYYLHADLDRNCPSGYRWFDYHCYKHMGASNNYDTERQWCLDEGGDLPLFDSRSEWYFLQHWHGNQAYRLGLKYDSDAGKFRQVDGKLESESYNRWGDNEPNNIGSGYYDVHTSSYKQYDDNPAHNRHTWCEKRANHHDAETLCATEKEIRSKAEPIYLSKESDPQLTFERCAQQCLEQNNPYSAVIDNIACVCMGDEPTNGTCIGADDSEKIYYEYTTDQSEEDFEMLLSQPEHTTCADASHTYYNGHCYLIERTSRQFFAHEDYIWDLYGPDAHIVSIADAAEARFIDEVLQGGNNRDDFDNYDFYVGIIDDRNVCDEGWKYYDGGCFHFRGTGESHDRATQQAYCQGLRVGADLVWFEDSYDRHYAMDRIMPADHASVQYEVWSGLYDTGGKTWRYPMWNNNAGYQAFRSGEGSGSGESCVIMRSNENDYDMLDWPCSGHNKLAVCRYNPRERDNGGFRGYVVTDTYEPLEKNYHRWIPNQGQGDNPPYCAYHHYGNKLIYQCNCQDSRYAIYEYPARVSNFTDRGSGKIEMFTPIQAQLTHDVGDLSENSVDFGHSGMYDWDKPFKSFHHYARDTGVQEVTWDSMDFYYQRANGSATYETVLPMAGSTVYCPLILDTTNEMECDVGATGETPTGTIDFTDGTTEDVDLQDSTIVMYGPEINRDTSTSHNFNGYGVVMYNTMFKEHGFIQAFEWNVIQIGTFKFVVWRPRCGDEEVFCSKSMACHTIDYNDDVCKTVNNVHKVNCGGNKWSLTARACVDSNGNKIAPTRRYHGAYSVTEFDNVGTYETTTGRKGGHWVTLKPEEYIKVRPGDFLGMIGTDGRYGDWNMGTGWTAHASVGDGTTWPQHGVGHWNYEFSLNAYVTTMKLHAIPHTYSAVGDKSITFTASDSYLDDDITSVFNNTVYELVEGLEIVDGAAVIKDEVTVFEVNSHDGYPVTYEWNFGDQTDVITELNGKVNHSFSSSGRYNVTVRAYNELSEDIAWTSVLIQAKINTGEYWQYDNSTQLNYRSVFKICIDDGNEVTYSITVGDGSVHSGVQVYEENPSVCHSGWNDRNTLHCYLLSPGSHPRTDAHDTCTSMYGRAFPAYYDSHTEYSNAWHINSGDDYRWGYHRVDGQYYDSFERPVDAAVNGRWYDGHGPGNSNYDSHECITHYYAENHWVNRACTDNKHTMCMYEGRCETFSLDITEIGTYDIVLKAQNNVSSVEESFVQYVQTPIEGLEILPIGPQKWGDTVVLEVRWTSGSMIDFYCYNEASATGTACGDFVITEPADGLAGTGTITIPVAEYEVINDHDRTVKFVNKISEMTVSQSFTVMYAIENLVLEASHDCAITAEDTVIYTLTADQMSHTNMHVIFNDQTTATGSTIIEDIAEMTADNTNWPDHAGTPRYDYAFDHIFPVEGSYTVLVNISNDISHESITRDIVIENPIRGYKYEATGPIPIWPGETARVDFKLIFDPSHEQDTDPENEPHLIPTDVTQSYKYGHPDCSGIEDIDECADGNNGGCEQICINTNGSYFCACDFNYHLDTDFHACLEGNGTGDYYLNGTSGNITTTTAAPNAGPTTTVAGMTTPDMWELFGQICPEATHSDMVVVTDSVTDDDYFDYEHYGTFEVTLAFSNCISDDSFTFTVDVDQPSMNLTIVNDEYILPWMTNSTLTTTMDWGSRINLTYNYNDTNPLYEIAYDRFYPNTAGHMWDVEGTFYPTVTAVNLVGEWSAVTGPVYIQYILAEALRVETRSIWTIRYPDYKDEVSFNVYLVRDYADMMPTNVTANVTFGDLVPGTDDIATLDDQYMPDVAQFDSDLDYTDGDTHVWTVKHNYTVGDTYTLNIDFQNWVSTLTVDVEFHAIEEIAPLELTVKTIEMDAITAYFDDPANYDKLVNGLTDELLHEHVDCGRVYEATGKNCIEGLRQLAGYSTDLVGNPVLRSKRSVAYEIVSSVSGNTTSDNGTAADDVYNPVPTDPGFKPPVTARTVTDFLTGVKLNITKAEIEEIQANHVNLRLDLSSQYQTDFDTFLLQLQENPPLTMEAESSLNSTLASQGLNDIINWNSLYMYYARVAWKVNSTEIKMLGLDGLEADAVTGLLHFPQEEPLTLWMDFARGSHLHFKVDWGDNYTEVTDTPFVNHMYDRPGTYTVKFTGFNAVSNRTQEYTVVIQRSVYDLEITGPEQATRNVSTTWDFDFGSIGTDACYMLDFKDTGNDRFPVDNQYFFFGLKATCNKYFGIQMAKYPQRMHDKTNAGLEEEKDLGGGIMKITNSFTFGTLGTYRVELTGKNQVSSFSFVYPVAVTKGPCFKPLVLLDENNPCEPNCMNGNENSIKRADPVELIAVVQYNCTTTTLASHFWQIVRLNDDGSEDDIFLPDVVLYSNFTTQPLRRLVIAEKVLEYGRYRFSLNVTMYDEEIWQIDYIMVNIIKSPLVLNINSAPVSTAFQRWKYSTNYTMNARDFSYDPDDETDDKDAFTFKWTCRRMCETMPEYDLAIDTVVTPMTSECEALNISYVETEDGVMDRGCFEDGYLESGLFTDNTYGVEIADLSFAYEMDYIIFEVYMFKDTRRAYQKLELNITQGMPPQIDPDICVSNCAAKVNFNDIYSMEANIINGRGLFNYIWYLFRVPVNDFTADSAEEIEYARWNDNLPSDGSKQTMCETGNKAKSLAWEPGFFTESDTVYHFFSALKVWRGQAVDNYGMLITHFQVNEPPIQGNCTAYPLTGNATKTKFNVNCTEFWDQHKPIKYQMGFRQLGSATGSEGITFTPFRPTPTDPTGGIVLPPGDPAFNSEMEIFVRARDGIGGQTLSAPMIVQSFKIPIDTATFDFNEIAGDPQQVSQMITSVTGCVGEDEASDELSQEEIDAMSEEEREEYLAQQEEKRLEKEAEAAAFKEQLTDIIKKIVQTTADDVNAVMGSSAALSKNPRQTTPAGAANINQALAASSQVLNSTGAAMNVGKTVETAQGMINTCANLQTVAGQFAADEQADADPAAARRRKREAGVQTADELLASSLETFGKISSVIGTKKVFGEGDTVVNSEKMAMNVMKQYADAFADRKLASGGDGVNGIALPPGDVLIGTGNDSAAAVSATTNNYNTLPFTPHSHDGDDNSTDTGPTGNLLNIAMLDDLGNPLNSTQNETAPVSHIFLGREEVPDPIIVQNIAVKLDDTMLTHKIILPKQSSIQVKMRRIYPVDNITSGFNETNSTDSTTTPGAIVLPKTDRERRSLDPFLTGGNQTYNSSIYDDLSLVFVLYFKKDYKPTETSHDFNCTLPVIYYDLDENTTVALGGAVSTVNCEDVWAEEENATCQTHTLNRDVYPLDREIFEYDDMQCYIPDTWIDAYDADTKLMVGVQHYWVNMTNITSIGNETWDDFSRGYMPEMIPVVIPEDDEEVIHYEMSVAASSCKYWSPFYEDYVTDGCEVGPLTEVNLTHCICSLLAPPIPEDDGTVEPEEYERKIAMTAATPGITFGAGLSIPMNTIDLSNSAFNNLGENPLVFSVMVSLMCLYLCLCIWASAQDRKDAVKAGVSPLLDNDPRDRYLYEVTVYTGNRSGSSTTAKVSMVFSGEEDETPPRLIFDDKRPVLQSGGVDSFVMAVPSCLGQMSHCRVWHDNSGSSPSWFFSRMQVVDMQTLDKYFFILDRWLAAGEDDGIIDRIVPLAGKDELTGFSHLFFTKARKDLLDGHIWFSIYGKPHKSNFTRVQRLTCCLSLLFATAAGNIFLYQDPTDEQTGFQIRLGPITLTIEQILSGIISSLIAFPINLIIVLIFKNTREPPYNLGKKCCAPCKKSKRRRSENSFAADELAHQAKMLDGGEQSQSRVNSFASLSGIEPDDDAVENYITEEAKKRNKKWKLPWGFLFVAYFLSLCVVGVTFWYCVEQAGAFGVEKSERWMAAFATSVIESIFMSQPIKVLGLALFFALVIKKPDQDEDVDPGLEKGEEYLHKHEKQSQKLNAKVRRKLNKYKNIPLPPTEEYLAAARALRQKEMKMMDIIWEVFLYIIFVYLLMMVSYGNRDPISHRLYSSLYQEFHDAAYLPDNGVPFESVTEYKSFWAYCNETLLPSLWPDEWYDGVIRDEGFTADRNSYRVGVPRLRQLRMPSEQCNMPMYKIVKECNEEYNIFYEDTGEYYPGWVPVTNTSDKSYDGPYPGWFWESSGDLDGFPFSGMLATYGGGGFNIELGHTREIAQQTINDLMNYEWLTPETRAVVVEFVIYNSNVNLFAVSSMTFEFLPTGTILPTYKMNLIRFDRYIGSFMITVMVSELLTFVYVIWFIYKEVKTFKAIGYKKYFKSFWNVMEFIVLLLLLITIAMFFARFALTKSTANNFSENPDSFVSFQFATTWDEIYGYLLSFIIFIATVKVLKLLRFNKKMASLGMTMAYIVKPLLSFSVAWGIVFIAFAQMAYLVFARLLQSFSTFIAASNTLFTLMLNKFDYKELEEADAIFAPIIFVSFTFIVTFGLVNFMITIILEGFAEVQAELAQKENEYEIVEFIVSKFKGAVGISTGPGLPNMNKEPETMVNETHHELMDRFEDFEEMFRDFVTDEGRGDENLIRKYEKEILLQKKTAKNKMIYSA